LVGGITYAGTPSSLTSLTDNFQSIINYCENGAYVAVKQTVCSSSQNSCGMTGTGFVTLVDSNERQVQGSTSSCSAQVPSDSLCNTIPTTTTGGTGGVNGGNGGGTGGTNNGNNINDNGNVDTTNTCSKPNQCNADGNVVNACTGGLVETCKYGCTNGVCNKTCTSGNICDADGNVHDRCTDVLVKTCKYGCTGSSCNGSPSATISTFSVLPSLVQKGDTTTVKWSTKYVTSCSVTGTNGDSWTGTSGTQTSPPIVAQTVYTITCTGEDGTTVTQSSTVGIAPTYNEH